MIERTTAPKLDLRHSLPGCDLFCDVQQIDYISHVIMQECSTVRTYRTISHYSIQKTINWLHELDEFSAKSAFTVPVDPFVPLIKGPCALTRSLLLS
jgi:hypothetical protein